MRIRIVLSDTLVEELDRWVGVRGRSPFIAEVIRRALEDERRWDEIEAALSAVPDSGHAWDEDPAAGCPTTARRRTAYRMSVGKPIGE